MTCANCLKPEDLCVCRWLPTIPTQTHVLILQHPQEPDKELGSAHIAHLCLPNSTLRVGLSWPNLKAALRADAQATEWVVLYLGSERPGGPGWSPFRILERHGETGADPRADPTAGPIPGLVVLDGTWSQAKTLWWRNPWLLKLRRAVLSPSRPSLYRRLRKEPRRDSLSTLEAIALSLSALEDPAILEQMLKPFRKLLELYRQRGRGGKPYGAGD